MTGLFRHITPVGPADATGPVAAVYGQADREFSTIGPAVMMLSPALLVPGWALLRESLVAGVAPDEITDEDVTTWRDDRYTDHCLLHLLAYGAFLAVGADRVPHHGLKSTHGGMAEWPSGSVAEWMSH